MWCSAGMETAHTLSWCAYGVLFAQLFMFHIRILWDEHKSVTKIYLRDTSDTKKIVTECLFRYSHKILKDSGSFWHVFLEHIGIVSVVSPPDLDRWSADPRSVTSWRSIKILPKNFGTLSLGVTSFLGASSVAAPRSQRGVLDSCSWIDWKNLVNLAWLGS